MPRQKPPIMVVFDEVVIWIAREGQRIEPKRIDRRFGKLSQPRPQSCQVWQVMAQNIMSDDVPGFAKVGLQPS